MSFVTALAVTKDITMITLKKLVRKRVSPFLRNTCLYTIPRFPFYNLLDCHYAFEGGK